jgi:flagellar L-ring protein precursor FlgH
MKRWICQLTLSLNAIVVGAAGADDIWDRRDHRAAHLFIDDRARRVGDNLTVIIAESTDISNIDARKMNKDTKAGGLFNFKGSTKSDNGARSGTLSFDTSGSSNRTFDGSSNYTSDQKLQDKMTVTVIDVLPNGNIVIEGFRRRLVSGEDRLIRLSGIVRPDDISGANTVLSLSIANFQLTYSGKGPESKFSSQGYLSKALNVLWPF